MMNLDITDAKKSTVINSNKDQQHEIEKISALINDNEKFRDYLHLKQEFQIVKPKKRFKFKKKL